MAHSTLEVEEQRSQSTTSPEVDVALRHLPGTTLVADHLTKPVDPKQRWVMFMRYMGFQTAESGEEIQEDKANSDVNKERDFNQVKDNVQPTSNREHAKLPDGDGQHGQAVQGPDTTGAVAMKALRLQDGESDSGQPLEGELGPGQAQNEWIDGEELQRVRTVVEEPKHAMHPYGGREGGKGFGKLPLPPPPPRVPGVDYSIDLGPLVSEPKSSFNRPPETLLGHGVNDPLDWKPVTAFSLEASRPLTAFSGGGSVGQFGHQPQQAGGTQQFGAMRAPQKMSMSSTAPVFVPAGTPTTAGCCGVSPRAGCFGVPPRFAVPPQHAPQHAGCSGTTARAEFSGSRQPVRFEHWVV